jgi:hypothetical protein
MMGVAVDWIPRHCVVPDGFRKGAPFKLYDYQFLYLASFYTVRGDVEFDAVNPILAPAFVYRRGLLVGPQKVGKNPLIASQVCLEGVGPALFAGWAGPDDVYACRDWGCRCGWVYRYEGGEPMGMPWPTPLIQITAFSQESTDNTYDALRPMIDEGPLHDLIPHTGEEFIRLPGGGRIDTVTSSAQSRLGQRVTFVPQDEVGLYWPTNGMVKLADTQYRGLSGMGGRASLSSNAWDPSQHSVAQQQFESPATDIYRQFVQPPKALSYTDRQDRRRIHRIVYPADVLRENGGHLDLDSIENEAADLVKRDAPQAARFYGNLLVAGAGQAFDVDRWKALARSDYTVAPGSPIVIGFDGSRYDDDTALIATEILTGYQWPLGIWHPLADRPIPLEEVDLTVRAAFTGFDVWRMYADPPKWESWIATWAGLFGHERVVEWWTTRLRAMAHAMAAYEHAITAGELSHNGDPVFATHIGNAVRHYLGFRDDEGQPLWVVRKDRPMSDLKMDAAVAGGLSWEARNDALAAGIGAILPEPPSIYETRGIVSIAV